MTLRLFFFLCLSLLAAGCDESVDIGHPPPVLVQTNRRALSVRGASRARLEQAIDSLAYGDRSAVRAVVVARSVGDAEATRRTLIRLGLDPVQVVNSTRRGPSEIVLTLAVALTAPCASAVEPTSFGDVGQSMRSLADCQQTNNLAQMVADPADLVAPRQLGPGDGAYLTEGVRAWRNRERPQAQQQRESGAGAGSNSAAAATPSTTRMP